MSPLDLLASTGLGSSLMLALGIVAIFVAAARGRE